jgi:hypothetical protein
MKNNSESLGSFTAVWDAFRNADMSHFPISKAINPEGGLDVVIVSQILKELEDVNLPKDPAKASEMASVMAKVRESLDEVKGLTEYQDQKATRLLTIVSFLSALAGGLLTIFSKAYPFQTYLIGSAINWQAVFVIAAYVLFGVFVVLAISGALVVFYATKTRFKWPKEAEAPRSRLFYAGIVSAPPHAWAKSFVTGSGPNKEFVSATELQFSYTKDYILESYLVAAKVADKLRYLMPAQNILYLTVKVMLAWVLVVGLVALAVQGAPS